MSDEDLLVIVNVKFPLPAMDLPLLEICDKDVDSVLLPRFRLTEIAPSPPLPISSDNAYLM